MNCADVREFLFAFLDSELDAPHSIDVQRHLDRCCDCARDAEIERAIRKQLVVTLEQSPGEIPSLDDSWRDVGHQDAGRTAASPIGRAARWRGWLAAAAAVALAVAGMSWFSSIRPHGATGQQHFADTLVEDLRHFVDEGKSLQIASSDRAAVSRWFEDKTHLAVDLPRNVDSRFRLLGGRKCTIDGELAAFAMYDVQGVPVSLVVVDDTSAALDTMTQVRHDGRSHWVDRCQGHTVVASRRGRLVYAAVSTLSERDLLGLMTGVLDEGD